MSKKVSLKKRNSIYNILSEIYPDPNTELNFKNEYQLLVAVMLSAQCTDKKVNDTTPTLFDKFKNFSELAKASEEEIAKIIKAINYYKTKSRHLVQMASIVISQFSNEIPKTHKELLTLPGVGRKTANVVLSELGIEERFPVDTHVFRVAKRLGLSSAKTRDATEKDLTNIFPSAQWRNLHHMMILHGRRTCTARNPKCQDCKLSKICSYNL